VKILLWHGYLLSGSGSNVYTLNIAAAWRDQGHDVVVMCQERDAARFRIVDAEGSVDPVDGISPTVPTGNPSGTGSCTTLRPDIGGLLPVYVYDDYEGFTVKRFVDLTEGELEDYTRSNVRALEHVLRAFEPDVVVAGHEVMGPYIALQACGATGHGYVAKLHGSALEYAVKKQERFERYAREGLSGATRVVGGSRYMIEAAATSIPGWRHKATVVNPGVDVDLFRPDEARIPGATVGFVGKLIAAKGVQNLVAALGATDTADVSAVVVGYGGDQQPIRDLADALSRADLETARSTARSMEQSAPLVSFLEHVDDAYVRRAGNIPITFTGRLEHDPLSEVLPTFDVLVAPSVVHEAFGMVAAEAAACGVLPLVPRHSGIQEAGEMLEVHLECPGMLTFDPADPVRGISAGIDRILSIDGTQRLAMGVEAARLARAEWSWGRVAEKILKVAV
jgi:glycosyltransferase involved in cell wall biosynthesis